MPLYISLPLIAICIIIQLLNKFNENYKKTIKKVPYLKNILFALSIVIIVFSGSQAVVQSIQEKKAADRLIQEKKYEIYASPSEIELMPRTNKNFPLTVSNNKDFAIFDVNLSICSDNKSMDPSSIEIDPIKKEKIPNVPFSMAMITLSNGCTIIVFHSISPHSSKEFNVTIKGEKVEVKSRISFLVYDWAPEPSLFDISIMKGQSLSLQRNFQDYFDDKSHDTEKIGQVFFQRWRAPVNPYFPKQKESKALSIGFYKP